MFMFPTCLNFILWHCYSQIAESKSSNQLCVYTHRCDFMEKLSCIHFDGLNVLFCSILKGNGITGGIPEEFGNLSSLTSLDLDNNRLSGKIPSTLGNLKKLQFL